MKIISSELTTNGMRLKLSVENDQEKRLLWLAQNLQGIEVDLKSPMHSGNSRYSDVNGATITLKELPKEPPNLPIK